VPSDDLLDLLADLAPREMRRALMTGLGNARLARRDEVYPEDLPKATGAKTKLGFLQ
jgi:ATP-dependent Lon protease